MPGIDSIFSWPETLLSCTRIKWTGPFGPLNHLEKKAIFHRCRVVAIPTIGSALVLQRYQQILHLGTRCWVPYPSLCGLAESEWTPEGAPISETILVKISSAL
jgi:hypothetical protein